MGTFRPLNRSGSQRLSFLILLLSFKAFGVPGAEEAPGKTYYFGFGEDKKAAGHSVAPVVGYDPTYGFVGGAAYFYEGQSFNLGIDGNLNFGNVYQAHARAQHLFAPGWDYEWRLATMRGFEAFYGDGGETSVSDYRKLWGDRYNTTLHLHHVISSYLTLGVFADMRMRSEKMESGAVPSRVAPDQSIGALGVSLKFDSRKGQTRSNDGVVWTTLLSQSGGALNGLDGKAFTQLTSSFVVYKEVMPDWVPGFVAAFRVAGGVSAGEVPFAFKYRMGGAERMRGYYENRFRGTKYYLQETELRFPIWRMIGGATALSFGDISDAQLTSPKMTYGFGLRIALPPDWVSQIRLDLGFSRDQVGLFAEFGQTF